VKSLPNAQWLGWGVLLTAIVLTRIPTSIYIYLYTAVGLLVACAFMAFQNPRTQPNRFDISMCIPILAIMWPVIVFAMALSRPWNDPKWKNRHISPPSEK